MRNIYTPLSNVFTEGSLVYKAASKARSKYRESRNADSDIINKCESFINSASASAREIENAIAQGFLKRVPSGRLYIQLS